MAFNALQGKPGLAFQGLPACLNLRFVFGAGGVDNAVVVYKLACPDLLSVTQVVQQSIR